MTRMMQIHEKMKEKVKQILCQLAHEQEQFKTRVHEKDEVLNEAKKQFETATK